MVAHVDTDLQCTLVVFLDTLCAGCDMTHCTVTFLCFVMSLLPVTSCLWFYTEAFVSLAGAVALSQHRGREWGDGKHSAYQPLWRGLGEWKSELINNTINFV